MLKLAMPISPLQLLSLFLHALILATKRSALKPVEIRLKDAEFVDDKPKDWVHVMKVWWPY
jgi:hypothetical protein